MRLTGMDLVGFMQQLGLNPRKPLKLDGDLYVYGSDMPRETVISKWELALTNQNIDPTDWTKLVVDKLDWQVFQSFMQTTNFQHSDLAAMPWEDFKRHFLSLSSGQPLSTSLAARQACAKLSYANTKYPVSKALAALESIFVRNGAKIEDPAR
jgi:hypothetical protein